ncbi:MAG: hypothetical protein ACO1Q7_08575 [Gemmatimonas sp.]
MLFPARIVLVRGIAIYLPIKILMGLLRIDSPVGVVLLVMTLGLVDIQRRHERLLWANLGLSLGHLAMLFGIITVLLDTVVVYATPVVASVLPTLR